MNNFDFLRNDALVVNYKFLFVTRVLNNINFQIEASDEVGENQQGKSHFSTLEVFCFLA